MADFSYDISLLYSQYYRPLCYFAEGLVGSAQTAEDLATDTFIKLLKKPVHFESGPNLKSYLYTVTKNACLDHLRKIKRRDNIHADILNRADSSNPDASNFTNAEHQMIRAEVLQTIYLAIEKLPVKYRQIVELSLLYGKKNEEIAADLNMAPQTIRNRKSEGYKILRVALRNQELLTLAVACWIYF